MMPETGDVELFSYAYDVSDKMESEEIMSLVAGANFDYIGFIFAETNEFEFIKKSKSIVFPEIRAITSYSTCCDYVRGNFVNSEERNQFNETVSLTNILEGLKKNERHVATYRREENGKISCKQLSYIWFDKAAQIILVSVATSPPPMNAIKSSLPKSKRPNSKPSKPMKPRAPSFRACRTTSGPRSMA